MSRKISVIAVITFLMFMPFLNSLPSTLNVSFGITNIEEENSILPKKSGTRSGDITFINVTDEVGLSGLRGDSYAWGDYNNDGFLDLLLKDHVNGKSHLFKNSGPPNWEFSDVTEEVGLEGAGYAVWGDYNNDGYLDFFSVGHTNANPDNSIDTLWMNQGPPDYSFHNVTEAAGNLDDGMPGLAAGWADYDRDGFLDLYVVNWRDLDNNRYPDVLYHNNGDGTFTDVTTDAGVWEGDDPYAGMGMNWGDYNNDGWPDIYVSNYLVTPNYLYENNGDGTFSEVAHDKNAAGFAYSPTGGYYGHTAGSSWADYDHDGDLDMWVSNLAHTTDPRGFYTDYSEMLRNNGPPDYDFTDVRDETGIEKKPYMSEDELHFGIAWGDYDNDGDYDMFIPQVKDLDYAYSYFFENNGDGTFTDVSEDVGVRVWNTDGACWADYNNDGYIDLITEGKYPFENGKYGVRLFKNNGDNANNWLEVELEASESNLASIGARVNVTGNGITQMKEVEGGTAGHAYQHSMVQHFGFGDYQGTVDVEVWWPSGEKRILNDVSLNQKTIISAYDFDPVLFELMFSNYEPYEGDIVSISATVQNAGRYDIDSLRVKFFDGEPDTNLIGINTLSNLGSGEKQNALVQWDTSGEKGIHTITALIEGITPGDNCTLNNIIRVELKVNKYVPDLIVSGISFSDSLPEEGDIITITAKIQNIGNLKAESATITFFDEYEYSFQIGSDILYNIQPDEYSESLIQLDTNGKPGNHTITVMIEYVLPEEDNTQNNIGSREIEVTEKTQEPPEPPPVQLNHPPEIVEFSADPSSLLMGESCTLTVYAEDEDDDPLSYTYQASDGFIDGKGNIVLWYAPEKEGLFEIKVTVKDTDNAEDEASVQVKVKANSPPEIKNVKVTPDSVLSNGIDKIQFTAEVSDENGLDDINEVNIDLSLIGGSSKQGMRDDGTKGDSEAEDGIYSYETEVVEGIEPGEKSIKITVIDESGQESFEEIFILVISIEEQEEEQEFPWFSFILFSLILLIVAVVAVSILAGRRNKVRYH